MPKRQTSFNPEWTKEHKFISKSSRDDFHGFCTLCVSVKCVFIYILYSLFVYLCIFIISGIQKCYVFWHCARLFVYLCISFISRSPGMLCFQALCTLQDRFISVVSFWNRHHNVLNKNKFCEQTLFASSVTHRSTSRYIVDQIVWQWIE